MSARFPTLKLVCGSRGRVGGCCARSCMTCSIDQCDQTTGEGGMQDVSLYEREVVGLRLFLQCQCIHWLTLPV